MSRFILSIDQGTTSTRCIIFDRDGIVASAQKEHRQIYPRPGWVEHDPLEIWENTSDLIRQAMASAGARSGDIAAVGIANQRETVVAWDRTTGRPMGNAIVWQDVRTAEMCEELSRRFGRDYFRRATGLPIATYFSGPKIRWGLEHVGWRNATGAHALAVGTIDSWLIWNLTGRHVTDVTNASRTLLMDLRTQQWDAGICAELGIDPSILPQIVSSSDRDAMGVTRPDGPLGGAVPVCGCLGDQQAALVGQTCFMPGESKNTYGTGCFMLLNTGERLVPSASGLLTTAAYRFGTSPCVYALEGSIAIAGALVQWLRDRLGIIGSSSEIEQLARAVDSSGGVYFVPAFSGLFAPYWRSDARGVLVGMTHQTARPHIARAALEATAYQTRDVLEAMRHDSGVTLRSLKVDGGMVVNELLMQFQSDLLDLPVVRPKIIETTALGAAYAAGLAVGYWRDLDELRADWQEDRTWRPTMPATERERLYAGWKKAVERSFALAWPF
jgi:glycerol kinase